jgi:diaminopimelate dehydrogenase
MKDDIDVMILCSGSAKDLPEQGPIFAGMFNTVDSFDTHAKIPEYFESMNSAAKKSGKTAIISVGWDPGLFSLNRLMGECVLPAGNSYTFWGPGVSQGHSDAIRRVEGVKNAIQYTIPVNSAVDKVRNGENPEFETRDKHIRKCYVVVKPGADKAVVENNIKNMPDYFSDYDTFVNFITEEELNEKHSSMPHGGFVIRSGVTGDNNKHIVEFSLKLDSNPEFTASVMTAYARAAYRLNKENIIGAKTVFDIGFGYLSEKPADILRKEML